MSRLVCTTRDIAHDFLYPYDGDCEALIKSFEDDMRSKKSLKMLNTYVFCNKVFKKGEYLALDIGGTNVRVSLYEVDSKVILKDTRKFALRGEGFDYTTSEYSLRDIFEMVADRIEEIIEPKKKYLLGHTFSFAIDSKSKNSAKTLIFSKGFAWHDAIGVDVNECLKSVLKERGLDVEPEAILNDTTATLLAGFSKDINTNIACILGTGHNMCFINSGGEIINTESGGFNSTDIPLTEYDEEFLNEIPNERNCLLEALVGGKNIAKLARVVIDSLIEKGCIKQFAEITPEMMSASIEGDLDTLDKWQNCALREVSKIIYCRAAHLIACELVAVFRYLGITEGTYAVAFDGSVYEKVSYFRMCLTKKLERLSGDIRISHMLVKDGSSVGAVIACAIES